MSFLLYNLAVIVVCTAVFWWLSGFDSRLTGELRSDLIRRSVRCGISLVVVEWAFYALWQCRVTGDRSAGILYLAAAVPLVLIWGGCITDAGAHCFHLLIDFQDEKRPFDPKAGTRELDAIGGLIRSGRKEEAIQLCRTLLQTSPELRTALETTLHHLGAPPESPNESKPLAEASKLRQAGKFEEAEAVLTLLLKREPSNIDAALMLIRLYGQDMRQPEKAAAALRSLEKKPHVPAPYLEFARRSIPDWQMQSTRSANTISDEPTPESVEDLIAKKYLGTAIEVLEKRCEEEPSDFDAWLKLAEVHGVHCANLQLAEKTIRQIEASAAFSSDQKQQARDHLREWRDNRARTA
jgi:tetratricopeptide (TPR) repeat protein